MTDSIFNQEDKPEEQQTTADSIFEIGDRKYTKDDVIKKITNADDHIRKIEEENSDLRKKMDEYMQVLAGLQKPKDEPPAATESPSAISQDAVAKLVKEQVNSFHTEQTRASNLSRVDNQLQELYGSVELAGKELVKKANELGLSLEQIKDLAETAPSAVLSWFSKPTTPNSASSFSTRNTEAVTGMAASVTEGSYAWWQELKKSDPRKYFSPEMTRRRMSDAERLGRDKFFGK